jgi:hypothetical protein
LRHVDPVHFDVIDGSVIGNLRRDQGWRSDSSAYRNWVSFVTRLVAIVVTILFATIRCSRRRRV